jgi:hypothetical protein
MATNSQNAKQTTDAVSSRERNEGAVDLCLANIQPISNATPRAAIEPCAMAHAGVDS